MKTRLNITVEQKLLEKVKVYAAKENSSISRIVEEHFKNLTQKKKKKKSLLDVIDEFPVPEIDLPRDFDFKEEYYKQKAKKYGY